MAVKGPAHGTNMGSMQALNTSSSVSGATTWFLSQRMSLKHSNQNQGSQATLTPSMKLQGQSIANCVRGPRNRTMVSSSGKMMPGRRPSNRIPMRASSEGTVLTPVNSLQAHTKSGDRPDTTSTLVKRLFITVGWSLDRSLLHMYKLPTYEQASSKQKSTDSQHKPSGGTKSPLPCCSCSGRSFRDKSTSSAMAARCWG